MCFCFAAAILIQTSLAASSSAGSWPMVACVDSSRSSAIRPGSLAGLASQIASTGASIKQVVHDRAFATSDVSTVNVLCTVETRNQQHLAELRAQLKSHGVETYDSK